MRAGAQHLRFGIKSAFGVASSRLPSARAVGETALRPFSRAALLAPRAAFELFTAELLEKAVLALATP